MMEATTSDEMDNHVNRSHRYYQSTSDRCNIMTAAKLLTALHTVLLFITTIALAIILLLWRESLIQQLCVIVYAFTFSTLFIILMLHWWGLCREMENYMIPFIVYLILRLIVLSMLALAVIVAIPILAATNWHKRSISPPFSRPVRAAKRISLDFSLPEYDDTTTIDLSSALEYFAESTGVMVLVVLAVFLELAYVILSLVITVKAYNYCTDQRQNAYIAPMTVSFTHPPTKV